MFKNYLEKVQLQENKNAHSEMISPQGSYEAEACNATPSSFVTFVLLMTNSGQGI